MVRSINVSDDFRAVWCTKSASMASAISAVRTCEDCHWFKLTRARARTSCAEMGVSPPGSPGPIGEHGGPPAGSNTTVPLASLAVLKPFVNTYTDPGAKLEKLQRNPGVVPSVSMLGTASKLKVSELGSLVSK